MLYCLAALWANTHIRPTIPLPIIAYAPPLTAFFIPPNIQTGCDCLIVLIPLPFAGWHTSRHPFTFIIVF
jgi:hypothetical protein